MNPQQTLLASASLDNTVAIWDASTRRLVKRLAHPSFIWYLSWRPDGQQLATACNDGAIHLWDVDTWTKAREIRGHERDVGQVGWSPDGDRLVSRGNDGTARIWDSSSGTQLGEPFQHRDQSVYGGTWSPDGRFVATSSAPGTSIFLWEVLGSRDVPAREIVTDSTVNSVRWNSTGTLLALFGTQWSDMCVGGGNRTESPLFRRPRWRNAATCLERRRSVVGFL